ncbi:MAG TPA: alpha/beta hydrolase-fold protein [Labilithrix sp.]|nr:alpha/beta hydrolase-fold protein [Labilithrix sp.]
MIRSAWLLVGPVLLATACSNATPPGDDEGDDDSSKDGKTAPVPSSSATAPAGQTNTQEPVAPGAATIRVHYPAGSHTLGLRGSVAPLAADKSTPLTAGAADTYELALGVIAQTVEFTPTLDDKPAIGPKYVVKPGQTADVYPYFTAAKGEVVIKWADFKSKIHASTRNIRVYTPPSYKENTAARYPVIYVHDGQTTFAGSTSPNQTVDGCLNADLAIDKGSETGTIAEAIIVGIDNGSSVLDLTGQKRIAEMSPTKSAQGGGEGPQYASMITDEIKPMVDKEYRTKPERESTFTIGASMGGLISAYLAFDRHQVFGGFGTQSGALWWDNQVMVTKAKNDIAAGKKPLRIYVDYGEGEAPEPDYTQKLVTPNQAFLKVAKEGGYVDGQTLLFNLGPKGSEHKSKSWGTRIPAAFTFLLGPGR